MKKFYLLLSIFGLITSAYTQKTTGTVTLGSTSMTAKIDLDNTLSKATLTLTGPSNRWLSLGLDATNMSVQKDVVTMRSATNLSDDSLPGGYSGPTVDAIQDWTITSNTVNATTRTVVATRAFNTGDANDYIFNYNTITSLNVIFAHSAGGSFGLDYHNIFRGSTTMTFTTLGVNDFSFSDKITIFPNPSNGMITISKTNNATITKIKIFDVNAKLLKEIDGALINQNSQLNLSDLSKGIYFMEISGDNDKIVKKILLN